MIERRACPCKSAETPKIIIIIYGCQKCIAVKGLSRERMPNRDDDELNCAFFIIIFSFKKYTNGSKMNGRYVFFA